MGLLDSLRNKLSRKKKKETVTSKAIDAAKNTSAVSAALPPQVRLALAGAAAATSINQNTTNPLVRGVTTSIPSIGYDSAKKLLSKSERRKLFDQQKADRKAAAQNPPGSGGLIDKARALIKDNPLTAVGIAAAGGALVGAGITAAVKSRKKNSTKKAKKKSKPRKSRSRSYRKKTNARPRRRRTKRSYGTEAQYKRKGGKDVHYDKRGHPYIIKANGMHRYIKRSR